MCVNGTKHIPVLTIESAHIAKADDEIGIQRINPNKNPGYFEDPECIEL